MKIGVGMCGDVEVVREGLTSLVLGVMARSNSSRSIFHRLAEELCPLTCGGIRKGMYTGTPFAKDTQGG